MCVFSLPRLTGFSYCPDSFITVLCVGFFSHGPVTTAGAGTDSARCDQGGGRG